MQQEVLDQYDAMRDFSNKAFKAVCYAPFNSMYFDSHGDVRVCCQNVTHLVGNVTQNTIREIWNSARMTQLREALINYDFSCGCRFCEWQLSDGAYSTSFMKKFDEFPIDQAAPEYPQRMEFSVSNTCNLECLMCNGEWSSSIRSRREKLPPLPKVYSDGFFEELRDFLPHLKRAKFLGGEPFLAQESLRIWDMMVELGCKAQCHVTTNGTQYNARVERILKALPVAVSISMDGATKETVETIRANAIYEEVMENFKRFHAYCRERKTYIGLTYSLQRLNWHEFGDYLLFGDQWGCEVIVNTVIKPLHCSLHVLPADELAVIVEALEKQNEEILPKLGKNKQVWVDQLQRLRNRLAQQSKQSGPNKYFVPLRLTDPSDKFAVELVGNEDFITEEKARRVLSNWAPEARVCGWACDSEGHVQSILTAEVDGKFFGIDPTAVLGKSVEKIHVEVMRQFGEHVQTVKEIKRIFFSDRISTLTDRKRKTTYVRSIHFPRYDANGRLTGTLTLAAACDRMPEEIEDPLVLGIEARPATVA